MSAAPGADNVRESKPLAREYAAQFCDYTSAHGLGRFAAQSNRVGRLVWVTFLIGTYTGFSYHLYTLFDRFASAPVLTTITASLPFEFPDVYICPAHALTMSSVVNRVDDQSMKNMQHPTVSLERGLYYMNFDMEMKSHPRYNGAFELKKSVLALSDTLAETEASLMEDFRMLAYINGSECRVTQSGEEYSGNVSTVPEYAEMFAKSKVSSSFNWSSAEPYVTGSQCIAWNEAARLLRSQGVTVLADRILAMNYSDSDSRCKAPVGLKLTDFFDHATRPLKRSLGCYNRSGTPFFATEFLFDYIMTHEFCLDRCYTRNLSYAGLQGPRCYCATEAEGKSLLDRGTYTTCSLPCPGNSSQVCGGEDTSVLTLLQIRDSGRKPLRIPYGNNMTTSLEGPYCFYFDRARRFSAYYCGIPFCASPRDQDCVPSTSQGEAADARQLVQYTGYVNVTVTGKTCLPWKMAVFKMQERFTSFYGPGYSKRLRIRSSDFHAPDDHNYCRAVSNVQETVDGSHNWERGPRDGSMVPGCFFENADGIIYFEQCKIPTCYTERPSITGVIRDGVGSDLLERQFGSDLSTGLTDCSFAGHRCTHLNFLNVHHPELGVCHLFQKPFTKMSSMQLANAQLSITFFTDTTDSFGRTFANISKMESIMHKSDGTNYAFRALVVPSGAYPRASDAINVNSAVHAAVQLRFDNVTRLSIKGRPCSSSKQPVSYRMPSWKSNGTGNSINLDSDSDVVMETRGWRRKVDQLRMALQRENSLKDEWTADMEFKLPSQQDCMNDYQVQKFVDNCKCLPSAMPIPTRFFSNYTYCFSSTDTGYLSQVERCYKEQMTHLHEQQDEALKTCQPMCQIRSYRIRETSHPWPGINRENSLNFLANLASLQGYKHAMKSARGVGSLYHTYLLSLNGSGVQLSNKNAMELLKFDYQLKAVENRLAKLTVQAWTPFGQEIVEEEAYPAKNLVADIGGTLGLWSGVSILTVCELLELMMHIGVGIWLVTSKKKAASTEAENLPLRVSTGEKDNTEAAV